MYNSFSVRCEEYTRAHIDLQSLSAQQTLKQVGEITTEIEMDRIIHPNLARSQEKGGQLRKSFQGGINNVGGMKIVPK